MSSSITIITAFFDIGRGNWSYNYPRSEQEYINYFENLATLENEMVIFTSKKYEQIKSSIWISKYRNQNTVGYLHEIHSLSGKRGYNINFDYVAWLNSAFKKLD